jgi:pre-mRNA branch site protein p14
MQDNKRKALAPEVNRILFVRNLPFKITPDEMYDIFGKYGPIRQIRLGDGTENRGKAFVIYEDIYDAKTAVDHLNGFNVLGRYLIVLYYQHAKTVKSIDNAAKKKELDELKARFSMGSSSSAASSSKEKLDG